MTDNIWAKAASAAFVMLALLAGWGLNDLYHLDSRVSKVEVVQAIWLTSTGHSLPSSSVAEPDAAHVFYASMPLRGATGAEFSQKAMVHAAEQVLQKDYDGAVKTLLVGIETTGLTCSAAGDHLECH